MVDDGVTAVVMETSSHALSLGRLSGVRFRAAAFTNLTQDHLDFHGDMEGYFQAKSLLFREIDATTGFGILNVLPLEGERTPRPLMRTNG